jgi:hypothetical protein
VRPEFDREPFERRLEAVCRADEHVDGYEALKSGLCDEHSEGEINDNGVLHPKGTLLQAVMNQCTKCRSPGEWVGKKVQKMKQDQIEEVLLE